MTREEEVKFRDECAMRVMQGLLSNAHLQKEFLKDISKIEKNLDCKFDSSQRSGYMQREHAMISYQFADAMLEEKKKRDEKICATDLGIRRDWLRLRRM